MATDAALCVPRRFVFVVDGELFTQCAWRRALHRCRVAAAGWRLAAIATVAKPRRLPSN